MKKETKNKLQDLAAEQMGKILRHDSERGWVFELKFWYGIAVMAITLITGTVFTLQFIEAATILNRVGVVEKTIDAHTDRITALENNEIRMRRRILKQNEKVTQLLQELNAKVSAIDKRIDRKK